jgi:hypothetical protein
VLSVSTSSALHIDDLCTHGVAPRGRGKASYARQRMGEHEESATPDSLSRIGTPLLFVYQMTFSGLLEVSAPGAAIIAGDA